MEVQFGIPIESKVESLSNEILYLQNSINPFSISERNLLSPCIEKLIEVQILHHYFTEGKLLPIERVILCCDEEYISATIDFMHDMQQYCMIRACEVAVLYVDD